jgi:hypothetical protein
MTRKWKMKNLETNKSANRPLGWIAVIAGILIFIAGIVLRTIQPGTIADTRLLEGFGILLTGWGIIPAFRSLKKQRNPSAAHRSELDEKDERAVAIRNQAAYIAFLLNLGASSIMLLLLSASTRGQSGFDPVWFGLAFLVIAPVAVFTGMRIWLNRK